MVALPGRIAAITRPFETDATFTFVVVHVAGLDEYNKTLVLRLILKLDTDAPPGLAEILRDGGRGAVTVNDTDAVKNPSLDVAVIVAEPAETAVTRPFTTVAIAGLDVAHQLATEAVSCLVVPARAVNVPVIETDVTGVVIRSRNFGAKTVPFTDPRPVQAS